MYHIYSISAAMQKARPACSRPCNSAWASAQTLWAPIGFFKLRLGRVLPMSRHHGGSARQLLLRWEKELSVSQHDHHSYRQRGGTFCDGALCHTMPLCNRQDTRWLWLPISFDAHIILESMKSPLKQPLEPDFFCFANMSNTF